MFALHQDSYRLAEARARQIVQQREGEANRRAGESLTASITESCSTTQQRRRRPYGRFIQEAERPPLRIQVVNRRNDGARSQQQPPPEPQVRPPVEEAINTAISQLETLETHLLKTIEGKKNDSHQLIDQGNLEDAAVSVRKAQQLQKELQAVASRIDYLEQRVCALSSSRQNRAEQDTVRQVLEEFKNFKPSDELASFKIRLGALEQMEALAGGEEEEDDSSEMLQELIDERRVLTPILEPDYVDPAAMDEIWI